MPLSQRRSRLVARLRARKTREREALVLVEGVRAVREALDCGVAVSFAVTSPKLVTTVDGAALAERLAGLDADEVADQELVRHADTVNPQGVLLVCRQPPRGLDDVHGTRLLLLDAVQDPGNVGTLIRAAVAFGLDGIVCLDGTADPWSAKVVRASAGTVFRSPPAVARAEEIPSWLEGLDVPLLVADSAGEDVEHRRGAAAFALAVGNEGDGVRDFLRASAHAIVAVPMSGPAESLNAGVAGSILMHTLTRSPT